MSKLIENTRRWLGPAALLLALALGLAYGLGWRVPGLDRHPSWDAFPHLTNPRLVVEQIPDFAARYGRRYHLPDSAVAKARPLLVCRFEEYYRTNLKSVRPLGYQHTGNYFTWGSWHFNLGGGNETGPLKGELASPHFNPEGYEYLELSVAGAKGYFKAKVYKNNNYLPYFYQYNYPAAATDTLFLRHASGDYRVYMR